MTTWEYMYMSADRGNAELNEYGRKGWEVYQVDPPKIGYSGRYYMRRRSDRYCEHCATATAAMDAMEKVAP